MTRPFLATALLILLQCIAVPAGAATFTVDNTSVDLGDLHPGDGKCEFATFVPVGQRCTLRAAIQESNALAGADTIIIPFNADIVLDRSGRGEEAASTGDLDITDSLVIGAPAGSSRDLWPTVDANGIDRVFDIHDTAAAVTFHDLKITGGSANTADTTVGGGIRADTGGSLSLARVLIVDNAANFGGGIYTARGLSMYASELRANSVFDYGFTNVYASAIGSHEGSNAGYSISIDSSSIVNNLVFTSSGVVAAAVQLSGLDSVSIRNTTFSGNSRTALDSYAESMTLNHVTITGSQHGYRFGGNAVGQTSRIDNTIIADNSVADCTFGGSYTYAHNYSMDSDDSCQLEGFGTGNLPAHEPDLAALAPSRFNALSIRAPRGGSPAIDSADPNLQGSGGTCLPEDEDGVFRPLDGDGGGARCDMGAIEFVDQIFIDGFETVPF